MEKWSLPPDQCIDLGNYPGAYITLPQLEKICELLRKHGKIEIHCGFEPWLSDIVIALASRTEQKLKADTVDRLITNRLHQQHYGKPQKAVEATLQQLEEEHASLLREINS